MKWYNYFIKSALKNLYSKHSHQHFCCNFFLTIIIITIVLLAETNLFVNTQKSIKKKTQQRLKTNPLNEQENSNFELGNLIKLYKYS
jgi:hypothetical protein